MKTVNETTDIKTFEVYRGIEIKKGLNRSWFVEELETGKYLYRGYDKEAALGVYNKATARQLN